MRILAAGATLLVCAMVGGCGGPSPAVGNVERVLKEDQAACIWAQTAAGAAASMRAIDTSACPNDFRAAYLAHVHAWEAMAAVEREAAAFRARNDPEGVLVESFIRGLLGDPLGKANQVAAEQGELLRGYNAASRGIRETFNRVEEVAVGHGAKLPKPVQW
jgi:hypothetical protein